MPKLDKAHGTHGTMQKHSMQDILIMQTQAMQRQKPTCKGISHAKKTSFPMHNHSNVGHLHASSMLDTQ